MTDRLDIHRASRAEQIAAYANVHDVWGGSLSLDEHVARRLASVQHNRALWYVGTLDGRVVVSLGCYPLWFLVRGRRAAGMAIGAVHTLDVCRGRGFASRLLQFVEEEQKRQGVELSLLYSDIDAVFYERLGYVVCPGWEADIDVQRAVAIAHEVRNENSDTQLTAVAPQAESKRIAELYEQHHGRLELCISRDAEYWNYLLAKQPDDEFHLLAGAGDEPLAFVRVRAGEGGLSIRDAGLANGNTALWSVLLAHVVIMAAERGVGRIGGWLPDLPVISRYGMLRRRGREITMLKPLDDARGCDEDLQAAARHFVEIDHV